MIIVVEIAGRTGDRACKEYEAASISAAVEAARRELRAYPSFRLQIFGSKEVNPSRENLRKSGEMGPVGAVLAYGRIFLPSVLTATFGGRHHAGA